MCELLRLPFFDPQHRDLFEKISSWTKNLQLTHTEENCRVEAKKLVKDLAQAGFLRLCVPLAYGGMHSVLDVRSLCLARESFAYHSALLDFAFVMQGLGSGVISLFGTDQQRQEYLPRVASGEYIAAFALSEELAGSDVASIACEAQKQGDSFVINGEKAWISNAGLADFYTVFARTSNVPGAKGISAFIVESSDKGFSVSKEVDITSPHPVGSLKFSNCKVPAARLIGKEGEGFKYAMSNLDVFRSTVGAAAIGMASRALHEAYSHALNRKLFGKALTEFQMSEERLADMLTAIESAQLLVYRAAWLKDNGKERVTKEAAMAKLYATEMAQGVIDKAIQFLGGRGVVRGNIVERLYRDVRPLRIYEGSSEVQKLIIATQLKRELTT